MAPVRFQLEDSFLLRGRGWVLAPTLGVEAFPMHAHLSVELVEPDGTARTVSGRFYVENLYLANGSSVSHGVVVLDESLERPIAGSWMACTLAEGAG